MLQPYQADPRTGESRTRAWLEAFLDDKTAFMSRLTAAVPMPLESLYVNKTPNKLKTFVGRASSSSSSGNGSEYDWCTLADVSKAEDTLYVPQRQALFARYFLDLNDHEIADRMKVPETTVSRLLESALTAMTYYLDN